MNLTEKLQRQAQEKITQKASLQEKLAQQAEAERKKQEQEIRDEIMQKEQEIVAAKERIAQMKEPSPATLAGKTLQEEEVALRNLQKQMQDSVVVLKKLFLQHRDMLREGGIRSMRQLMDEHPEDQEVLDVTKSIAARAKQVVQRDAARAEYEQKAEEEKNISREEMIRSVEKHIAALDEEISLLRDQLPEVKEKRKEECITIMTDKLLGNKPSAKELINSLEQLYTASSTQVPNMFPKEYFDYTNKEGYGQDFLQEVLREMVVRVMNNTTFARELADTKEYIESATYTEQEIGKIREGERSLEKNVQKLNTLLAEEVKKRKCTEVRTTDVLGEYLPNITMIDTAHFFGGSEEFFTTYSSYLNDVIRDRKIHPSKHDVFASMDALKQFLAEIEMVHTTEQLDHPLHVTQLDEHYHDQDYMSDARYIANKYPIFEKDIRKNVPEPKYYSDQYAKNYTPQQILQQVETSMNDMNMLTEKLSSLYASVPTVVEQKSLVESQWVLLNEQKDVSSRKERALNRKQALIMIEEQLAPEKGTVVQVGDDRLVKVMIKPENNYEKLQGQIADLQKQVQAEQKKQISWMDKLRGGKEQKEKDARISEIETQIAALQNEQERNKQEIDEYHRTQGYFQDKIRPLWKMVSSAGLSRELKGQELTIGEICTKIHSYLEKDASISFAPEKEQQLEQMVLANAKQAREKATLQELTKSQVYKQIIS